MLRKQRLSLRNAVSSKVEEARAELEEHYQTELKSQVETVKEELTSSVDKYLSMLLKSGRKKTNLQLKGV